MKIQIDSYSLYYSQNSYLGILYAYERLSELPVEVIRRPIYVPKSRGVTIAEFLGGKGSSSKASYNREDCFRWAKSLGITFNPIDPATFKERAEKWSKSEFEREELPSRVYYASVGTGREEQLDKSLYQASFVERLDVNELDVVEKCIEGVGLNPKEIWDRAFSDDMTERIVSSLEDFEMHNCPGVPTWVVNGERFWGKDRVDVLFDRIHFLL